MKQKLYLYKVIYIYIYSGDKWFYSFQEPTSWVDMTVRGIVGSCEWVCKLNLQTPGKREERGGSMETEIQTAVRETEEETGLIEQDYQLLNSCKIAFQVTFLILFLKSPLPSTEADKLYGRID